MDKVAEDLKREVQSSVSKVYINKIKSLNPIQFQHYDLNETGNSF